MSGLSALKFVASKPQQGNSPKHARRLKLSNKLHEQIQMAKAVQSGAEFVPVKIRTVKDEATGETRKVEIPKRLKPWWWSSVHHCSLWCSHTRSCGWQKRHRD